MTNPSANFDKAFQRFEKDVDTSHIKNFNQLFLEFMNWGGKKAIMSPRQTKALKYQADNSRIGYVSQRIEKTGRIRIFNVFTGRYIKKSDIAE